QMIKSLHKRQLFSFSWKNASRLAGWMSIFILSNCYATTILETENASLCLEAYLRKDLVSLENTVDLDSSNEEDKTTYLGIDYSFAFNLDFKDSGPKFYLKLERNGPFDYDVPLFTHNILMTTEGTVEEYRKEELLPQIEEYWFDTAFLGASRLKLGLFTYIVGNGLALNGSFENYSFCVYRETEDFQWRLYYCRPDLVYKNHLGPRIRQEEGIDYNHNSSNFFAFDAKFQKGKNEFWPYIGILADYTSEGKRNNAFTAPIKRDLLGTIGIYYTLKQDKLSANLELARNFGKGRSESPDFEDVEHSGYLIFAGLDYEINKFKPFINLLVASGNKVPLDVALNGDDKLTSGKNRAFSYFSPLNNNFSDSIAACYTYRPVVATGAGYGLQYGLPRPATFSPSDFDNLIMPFIGFDFQFTKKLLFSLYGYYIRSFQKGVGLLNAKAKRLSADLGKEIDLFIDYRVNEKLLISFLTAYFFPGDYYKEIREDITGSLFSPLVRQDGCVDPAFQIELSLELKF
ncbi:MAG: hypothetical protein NC916_00135, partial [Candidatus Omnitrophica bacterium]|nr:hypothetical protein [Candidatus Omnitrophota bacterium]